MYVRILMLFSIFACGLNYLHAAVTVGDCEPSKHPYSTITAALEAAPNGAEIHVCPGTYPEKLTIQKSVTLRGIGEVSLTFPPNGLAPQPGTVQEYSSLYAQIYISNIEGTLMISNITVQGGSLFVPPNAGEPATTGGVLCDSAELQNYWAVVSLDSHVVLDHVNVTGHSVYPLPPGSFNTPGDIYCGNGLQFQGGNGTVSHSVVSGFGVLGISGASVVDHSLITGAGGARSIGVTANTVIDNTVTGPGYFYIDTTGIAGGNEVRGNVVQGWALGIHGEVVKHNTLIKNEVAVSGAKDISDILVVADSTYPNPACINGLDENTCNDNPSLQGVLPTTAIDLACEDGTLVRDNSIVGAGIGFANVDANRTISTTNLSYNVTTESTTCAQQNSATEAVK